MTNYPIWVFRTGGAGELSLITSSDGLKMAKSGSSSMT